MRQRIVIVFIGFIVLWSALAMRAAYLQFLPHQRLESLKNKLFQTNITLQSRRGAILDRNGRDMALSSQSFSLYADPKIIEGKRELARKLSKLLNLSYDSIYNKIKDPQKRFIWIGRQLDKSVADQIKKWNVRGLAFVEEWRRVYPNESLLSQTIGFLGADGEGLEGLELSLDSQLRGNKKKVLVRRDARGRPLLADGLLFTENPDGNEVTLTIDADLQYSLESELANAVKEFEADSAVGIILDPTNSEILATATAPTFDANKAQRLNPEFRRNKVITDLFEPGSTMKTFVIASALHEKIIAPNTKYNCENGQMRVGDRIIREADSDHKFGNLTVSEILAVSSNIGSAKIAFDLGADSLKRGLENFGFGSKLGVDLPGEGKGIMLPLPWRPHLLSNISFGHGISVTPLQIANAFAAIANGGTLHAPYILKSFRDPETGVSTENKSRAIRQVLTKEEAAQMRIMLAGVSAPGGTGVNAKVEGYVVAGKTGTAQKVNPNGRGYLKGAYVSSFGGFIPANDPKFVIYVAVDNPKKAYYGSQVAAPVFSRLASYAVRKSGVAPMLLTEKNIVGGKAKLTKTTKLKEESNIEMDSGTPFTVVPDLTNLTLREVLRRLGGQDLKLNIQGEGIVSAMEPPPGTPLPADKNLKLILTNIRQ